MSNHSIDVWNLRLNAVSTAAFVFAAIYAGREWRKSEELRIESDNQNIESNNRVALLESYRDYAEFLKLTLEYPDVNLGDEPLANPPKLTDVQRVQEVTLFTFFFSMIEGAYLLYMRASSDVIRRQWRGWEWYIDEQFKRPNFRRLYDECKDGYDEEFLKYISDRIARIDASSSS